MQHHDSLWAVLISVVLAVSSLVGLIGLAGRLVPGAPGGAPGALAVAAVVVSVLALAGAGVRPGHAVAAARPGDLSLSARDTRYSTNHLIAQGQQVSVRMTNHDLFWHTFTVKGLGVDLKVPVDGTPPGNVPRPAGRL